MDDHEYYTDEDEDEYEVPDEDDSSSNLDEPDDLSGQREDIEEDVIPDVPVPVILKDQFDPQNPKMDSDPINLFAVWQEEKRLRDIKRQENCEKAIPILEIALLAAILNNLHKIYMTEYPKKKGILFSYYEDKDLVLNYHSTTNMINFCGIQFNLSTGFDDERVESYLTDQNLKINFVEQLSQLQLTYQEHHTFDFTEQLTRINEKIMSLGFCVKEEIKKESWGCSQNFISYGFPE